MIESIQILRSTDANGNEEMAVYCNFGKQFPDNRSKDASLYHFRTLQQFHKTLSDVLLRVGEEHLRLLDEENLKDYEL